MKKLSVVMGALLALSTQRAVAQEATADVPACNECERAMVARLIEIRDHTAALRREVGELRTQLTALTDSVRSLPQIRSGIFIPNALIRRGDFSSDQAAIDNACTTAGYSKGVSMSPIQPYTGESTARHIIASIVCFDQPR